jgi:hypothetical protein
VADLVEVLVQQELLVVVEDQELQDRAILAVMDQFLLHILQVEVEVLVQQVVLDLDQHLVEVVLE